MAVRQIEHKFKGETNYRKVATIIQCVEARVSVDSMVNKNRWHIMCGHTHDRVNTQKAGRKWQTGFSRSLRHAISRARVRFNQRPYN